MKLESLGVIFNEDECVIEIKYNLGYNNVKFNINENKSKVLLRDLVEGVKYFKQTKSVEIEYVANENISETFEYEIPKLKYDFSDKKIRIEHSKSKDIASSWSEVRKFILSDLPNTRPLNKFLDTNYIELTMAQMNEVKKYAKLKKTHFIYF